MKRIRIIAALLLALSVCGCAVKEAGVAEGDSLPEIIIGSDNYEPYNYIDGDGNFSGVDVELARAAFEKMGYRPVFKQIVWENKDDYLKNGEVDCLWGCFTMTGRENKYIWAGPYLKSRQVVAVRADSDIKSISGLNERRVAVQASSIPRRQNGFTAFPEWARFTLRSEKVMPTPYAVMKAPLQVLLPLRRWSTECSATACTYQSSVLPFQRITVTQVLRSGSLRRWVS